MPIYEYECTSCHHHFDLMQKINADPIKQCPVCEKDTVTKLISAAGFQLKGTGWYATDFKNKSTAPVKTADASTKTDSGTTTSTTTKGESS